MPGIFISYRRSDTAPDARRLREHLSTAFGDEYVFMDVDSLRPGEPFPQVLEATITSIEAVLALIGPDWLTVTDASGRRRLEDPGDFVRIELATAFQFDRVVIPVLLGSASMPPARELPEQLVPLVERHAIEITVDRWDEDTTRLVRRLEEVVDTIPPCPYPGMVPYRRRDAERFFGRAQEIREIEDRLATQRLLCLVGPSGSGKSSLLEAGVLADLERTQPGRWVVSALRPGSSPARDLFQELGVAVHGAALTPEETRQAVIEALSTRPGSTRLLLVVDQLEELFAQAEPDEQARFIAALAAMHGSEHVSIMVAIRADFYGELMESALWPLVERAIVDVPPLVGDALAEAIAEPARTSHVTLEPDLLERLLIDAGKEPGALPLLQETLVQLWGMMRLHRISLAAYESLGGPNQSGLSAAVADTADAAFDSLPSAHLPIAKRVLLRLVQFGEGRPDTRRQLRFEDLRSEGDDDRVLEGVLDHLARYRLVTLTGSAPTEWGDGSVGDEVVQKPRDEVRVDLAHEALITGWPAIRGWLAERRDAEQGRRRLEAHVETWEGHDRAAALLDDVELKEAKGWLAGADAQELGVPPGLSELVGMSEARLKRRNRLRRGAITGLAVLLIAATVLAAVFLRARNDAIHRANVALSRERASSAMAALNVDPHQSLRLAVQAVDVLERDDSATAADRRESEAALRDAIRASRVRAVLRGHSAEVVSATFSADGERVVTASWDGTARIWNARTGATVAVLGKPGRRLESASFSPDGTRVVTAGDDGSARVWDAATGAERMALKHDPGASVLDGNFSPDGRLVATAGTDGSARVWEASTGRQVAMLPHARGATVFRVTFSPDGARIATAGSDGIAAVWSSSTGEQLSRLPHGATTVTAVRFSSDGSSLATATGDGTARVWRVLSPARSSVVLRGHRREVTSVEFSPGGTRVVTASLDGTARVWDARTGHELTVPLTHGDAVRTAEFSPDGTRVVTASADQTARIWDARTGEELAALRGHDDYVGSAEYSPDGSRVVTSSFDRTARVWDATVGDPAVTIGGEGSIASAMFSPDGRRLVTTATDGDPQIWSTNTGTPITSLTENGARVVSAVLGADGRDVITADANGDVRVWDAATGKLRVSRRVRGELVTAVPSRDGTQIAAVSVSTAEPPRSRVVIWAGTQSEPMGSWDVDGIVQGAVLSSDGARLAVWTQDGRIAVREVPAGDTISSFPASAPVASARFSPDGSLLVTAGDDGTARIWDVTSGRERQRLRHDQAVVAASFSADGTRVLTASADNTAKIWDAPTGRQLVSLRGHGTELTDGSFSPSGRWVATASLDGTARVWDALTGQEIALFRHPAEVTAASLDLDERLVLTLAADGRARLFRCETCVPLDGLARLARSRLISGLE